MGETTAIAWTDHTFNPWWGCTKVGPGCANCYAEKFDKRTGGAHWGPEADRRFFGDKHWNEPHKWNRAAEAAGVRRRVFCGSMCDVFEARGLLLDDWRAELFALIRETPHLDWLLLTKRPENIKKMLPRGWGKGWPNVWIGASAVTQREYDNATSILSLVDARVLFISCEPQLEEIVADEYGIQWTICGGESGPGCRPFNVEWARTLLASCRHGGSAFFMKQLGGFPNKRDRLDDLPEDLRVREFPRVSHVEAKP